jgi:hypothetical protein
MKTRWTRHKFERLYQHYNEKYWGGKLHAVRVGIKSLNGSFLGTCKPDFKYNPDKPLHFRIIIDVDAHKTDQEIHSTFLHELCHVGSSLIQHGHGSAFRSQIRQLFIKHAPLELYEARHLGKQWFKNQSLLCALEPRMVDAISSLGRWCWTEASIKVMPLQNLLNIERDHSSDAVRKLIEKCKMAHRRARRKYLAEMRLASL